MSYFLDQKEKYSAAEANKKLFKEKMDALKESKGDLGELVRKTPGASADVISEDGETKSNITKYGD